MAAVDELDSYHIETPDGKTSSPYLYLVNGIHEEGQATILAKNDNGELCDAITVRKLEVH